MYLASYNLTSVAVKILMKIEGGGEEQPAALSSPSLAALYKEAEVRAVKQRAHKLRAAGAATQGGAVVESSCAVVRSNPSAR